MRPVSYEIFKRGKLFVKLGLLAIFAGVASQSNLGLGSGATICGLLLGYSKWEINRYHRSHPAP